MKKPVITFRKAVLDDVPLLVEKVIQQMQESNRWDKDTQAFFSSGERNWFTSGLNDSSIFIILAFDGNVFAGMGGLEDFHNDDYIEFFEDGEPNHDSCASFFYTEPSYRHRGIMHHIFQMVLQEARGRGLRRMRIFVDDTESLGQQRHRYSTREQARALGFADVYGCDANGIYGELDVMDWIF